MQSNALASAEQIGALARHVEHTLEQMVAELSGGEIAARPYFKSDSSKACNYCKYGSLCGFEDGKRGESLRVLKSLKNDEAWAKIMGIPEGGEDNG